MKNFINGLITAAFFTFFAGMVYLVHMDNQVNNQQHNTPAQPESAMTPQDSALYLYDNANIIRMQGQQKKDEILQQADDSDIVKEIANHAKQQGKL